MNAAGLNSRSNDLVRQVQSTLARLLFAVSGQTPRSSYWNHPWLKPTQGTKYLPVPFSLCALRAFVVNCAFTVPPLSQGKSPQRYKGHKANSSIDDPFDAIFENGNIEIDKQTQPKVC